MRTHSASTKACVVGVVGLVGALAAPGCGEPRRYGDAGGQAVTITVHLERSFLARLHNTQGRASIGAGAGFSPAGGAFMGSGLSFSFSTTEVDLLGGDEELDGSVFDQQVHWGDTTFEVPLQPGRRLFLSLQAHGGREGIESLGAIQIPAMPPAHVDVTLSANEAHILTSPAPASSPPPPPPPVSPPADAGPPGPRPGPPPGTAPAVPPSPAQGSGPPEAPAR